MKLSMSTLGCPTWNLDTIGRRASEHGYDGVDFRGIGETLDVTRLPAFTTHAHQTKRWLADLGLAVSGISSSIALCDRTRRSENLDEARRTLDAAVGVGAAHVRVFGGGSSDRDGYADAAAFGVDCIRAILALPDAHRVSWNLETHDHWVRAVDCRRLLDGVTDEAFGVAFDFAHTVRIAGERAAETLDALGDRVRYVHVKDAVHDPAHPHAMSDGWRYVLPGSGSVDAATTVRLLRRRGYAGWLMFEHEKRWHAHLEAPEVALPAFTRWARGVLSDGA